jgi:hypothetical protein
MHAKRGVLHRDIKSTCDCERKYINGEYRKKLETREV